MEHATWNGMERNKTKTEKLTQPVRSVHKAQHSAAAVAASAAVAHRQRTQQQQKQAAKLSEQNLVGCPTPAQHA